MGKSKETRTSVPPKKAFLLAKGILPSVVTKLQQALVGPVSGEMVEQGFPIMDLIMNRSRSSINISKIDKMVFVSYQYDSDNVWCNQLLRIQKKRDNRSIEL